MFVLSITLCILSDSQANVLRKELQIISVLCDLVGWSWSVP